MISANRWLRGIALMLSILFLVGLTILVGLRIGHPYVLEWQEGAMVDQCLRILRGLPLYVAPSIDFVPQLYAPLFFYLGAGFSALFGEGFLALRLVSVASTVGAFLLLGLLAWRESADPQAALLATGFFAACYPLSAAWFDVARVDMLFLFLVMAGVAAARWGPGLGAAALAGVLFWLAFLTKQQAVAFAVAMVAYGLMARQVRAAVLLAVSFSVLALASTALLDRISGGWSTYYVFVMPGGHEYFWPMLLGFWHMDLLRPMAPACLLAAWLLFDRFQEYRHATAERADFGFWLFLLGASVATAWLSRLHWGGAQNVVIPAYFAIALAWGVGIVRLANQSGRRALWVNAVAVLQLLWLLDDPRGLVPDEEAVRAGDQWVERLGEMEGEVLATWHGYLPERAGKRVYAHRTGIHDVMRAGESEAQRGLALDMERAMKERRFSAIIVDQPYFLRPYFRDLLNGHYERTGRLLDDGLEVGGLLGYRANPFVYRPRSSGTDADRRR